MIRNILFNSEEIQKSISLLEWYLLARHVTPCPECGTFLTSLWLCPNCGKRFEIVEKPANTGLQADGANVARYWQNDETGRQCVKAYAPNPRWFEITQDQYEGKNGADDYPAKPPRR